MGTLKVLWTLATLAFIGTGGSIYFVAKKDWKKSTIFLAITAFFLWMHLLVK